MKTKTNKIIVTTPKIEPSKELSIGLEIVGTAELIQNCFNQKAIEEMLKKHMGLPVEREKKIPADCIERAIVRNIKDEICLPPTALKKAILSAASNIKTVTKTKLRSSVFVEGGSLPIKYSRMIPRMDMVKTSGIGHVPDVRFRPSFEDWSTRFIILFPEQIPVEMIIELIQLAGKVGVGEWRPEKDGTYGTFEISRAIDNPKELKEVREKCRTPLKKLIIPDWTMNIEMSKEILAKIGKEVA